MPSGLNAINPSGLWRINLPVYNFKCNDCGELFETVCKISEMKSQKCDKCGSINYEVHHSGNQPLIDPVRLGVRRIDDGFREVLSKIHNNNYKSNLGAKLSRSK